MTCVQCGTALPDGALFCGECGHEVTARKAPVPEQSRPAQLVCGQCGAAMNPEEIFCGECGFVARGVARRADAPAGLPGAAGAMPLFASVPSAPAPPAQGWAPPPRLSSAVPPSAPVAPAGATPPPVPLAPRPVVPPAGSTPGSAPAPALRTIPPVPVLPPQTGAVPVPPPASAVPAPSVSAATPPPPGVDAASADEAPVDEMSESSVDDDPTALLPAADLEDLPPLEPAPVTRSTPVVVDAEPVSGAGIPPASFLVALPEHAPAPTVSPYSRPISIIPPPRVAEEELESASAPFGAEGDGVVYSADERVPEPLTAHERMPEPLATHEPQPDAAPAPAASAAESAPLAPTTATGSVPVAPAPPGGPPALVEPAEAPAPARIPTGPIDLPPGSRGGGLAGAPPRVATGSVPLVSASAPVAPPVPVAPPAAGSPPPAPVPQAPLSAVPPLPVAPPAPAPQPPIPTGGVPMTAGRTPAPAGDWAQDEDEEDLESTRITGARPLGGTRFVLQFSTGESVTTFGTGLVGRNPQPQPGEYFDQLVRILDPGKSVSKTHLEFGQESGVFWISDRFSGNGTILREPDAAPRRCDPGKRYRVSRGARIEIGEQFVVLS